MDAPYVHWGRDNGISCLLCQWSSWIYFCLQIRAHHHMLPSPRHQKKKKVQIGAGWQSGTLKWWGKYEIVSKNGEGPVWASLLWNLIFCFISVGPLGKKILGFLLFYYYFLNIRYFLPPRWKLLLTEQEGQRLWCWKMFQAPSISPSKPPKQPTKCVLILQEARDESLCG